MAKLKSDLKQAVSERDREKYERLMAEADHHFRPRFNKRRQRVLKTVPLIVLIAISTVLPLTLTIPLFAMILIGLTFNQFLFDNFALWQVFSGMNALLLIGVVATAWFYPQPLPHAVITTQDGKRYEGSLVATETTQWFVAVGDTVVGVPVSEMRSSRFKGGPHYNPPSTIN